MKKYVQVDLTIKLVNIYEQGGVSAIKKFLLQTERECFLKRHHQFKVTLEGAEILCQKLLLCKDIY